MTGLVSFTYNCWVVSENNVYAIVQTGGKQYRVTVGDRLRVDAMHHKPGEDIQLDQVLLVSKDGEVTVGSPLVAGAKVDAKVERNVKSDKVTVFKYKPKVRYRRKTGHRQPYTELAIKKITLRKKRQSKASRPQEANKSEEE